MYTLIMLNDQGASETTKHETPEAVQKHINTWQADTMTARVFNDDGQELYDGPALDFTVSTQGED